MTPLEAADFAHDLLGLANTADRSAGGPMTTTETTTYTGIIPDHCPGWCDTDHAQVWESTRDTDSAREHFLSGGENRLEEQRWNDHVLRPQGGRWTINVTQPTGEHGYGTRFPTVDLELDNAKHDQTVLLHLTTGEARVLAAHLVGIADKIDLNP